LSVKDVCPHLSTVAEDEQNLKEAKECAERLTALRPKSVQASEFSKKWKVPFKAAMIRELLLYRATDLAGASIGFFEQKRIVPAAILTRQIVETFAVLFVFDERLERFIKDKSKNVDELDDFLMCSLMGSKNKPFPGLPEAVNILNRIDRVDKTAPGFRDNYDALSEYVHPNWAGVLGAYGETVEQPFGLNLVTTAKPDGYAAGLFVLLSTLKSFEGYYKQAGESVRRLNDCFEKIESPAK
jgi:hypothetical protein